MMAVETWGDRATLSAAIGSVAGVALLGLFAGPVTDWWLTAPGPAISLQAVKGVGRPGDVATFVVSADPTDCPVMIYGVWQHDGRSIETKTSMGGYLAPGQARGFLRVRIPTNAPRGELHYSYMAAHYCDLGDWSAGPSGRSVAITVE